MNAVHDIEESIIDRLLMLGSTRLLAREVGDLAAARALHELTERAPAELQPSWPMVLAWGQHQKAYRVAARLGDSDAMLKASAAQAKLIKDLY